MVHREQLDNTIVIAISQLTAARTYARNGEFGEAADVIRHVEKWAASTAQDIERCTEVLKKAANS